MYPNTTAYYASKAFLTLEMAKIIKNTNLNCDVASIGEAYISLEAGITSDRLLFHGNNKTVEEYTFIFENNIKKVVIDNIDELKLLDNLTTTHQKDIHILIRTNPKLQKINTHKRISTGHKESKFGMDLSIHLQDIIELSNNNPYIHLDGFHMHLGSQLKSNQNHLDALDYMFQIIVKCKENYNILIKELNIGGGYGVNYHQTDHYPNFLSFIKPVMNKIRAFINETYQTPFTVSIEPGRMIVASTAITLYNIGYSKPPYLTINGGMTDNLRVALYQSTYDLDIANKINHLKDHTYTIVGNACESTDIMFKNVSLPKAETNDTLIVYHTGAYEESLANNFNKMLKPAIVMLDNKKHYLIKKRETLNDLLSRERNIHD
jgi:diaminopimelate decarboxylase